MNKLLEKIANDFRHLGLGGLREFYHGYEKKIEDTDHAQMGPIDDRTVQASRLWAQGYRRLSAEVATGRISVKEARKYGT